MWFKAKIVKSIDIDKNCGIGERTVTTMNVIERIKSGEIVVGMLDGWYEPLEDNGVAKEELLRLAKLGAEMQWISVSERLPDKCCSCFIWHISDEFGGMCIAAHYNSIKKTFGHEERFGGKTTHWMPMIYPPKDGDKNEGV